MFRGILAFALTISLVCAAKVTTKEDYGVTTANKDVSTVEAMVPDNKKNVENKKDMPDLTAVMNECNESFRIEMSYLDALNESGSFPDETDRTPKCYVRCVLEKTGVASEEGEFDSAQTALVFAEQRPGKTATEIEETAAKCAADRKESCKCERSYQFMKCLAESEIKKSE